MTVIDTLNTMQRNAVEQLRAGDHNEFLVGFLTTSVMLELSNLVAADLDLDSYAQAVVEVLTQHAPIERCLLGLDPYDLPPVFAAIGFDLGLAAQHAHLPAGVGTATFTVDLVVSGTLHVDEVPPALHAAGFTDMAADQIASGLTRVVEGEQLRRKAAAAKALRAVAGLDERWGGAELEDIAFAIAALPAVTGATINATAARFADTIAVDAGRQGPHQLERQITVDGQLVVSLVVGYAEMPAADHIARLDDVVEALNAGLERIEQNIRLAGCRGRHRSAHRSRQPSKSRQGTGAGAIDGRYEGPADVGAAVRPGPLQADQRSLRPRCRRPRPDQLRHTAAHVGPYA